MPVPHIEGLRGSGAVAALIFVGIPNDVKDVPAPTARPEIAIGNPQPGKAKSQALATGLGLGIELFDRIFPGYGALTPIAGQLVANGYSRTEESEADAHGVVILRRAGYDGKTLMADTLGWLKQAGAAAAAFWRRIRRPTTASKPYSGCPEAVFRPLAPCGNRSKCSLLNSPPSFDRYRIGKPRKHRLQPEGGRR